MSDWRLVVGSGIPGADAIHADGARNMAVDDVLFDAAKRGAPPTLRFYRWEPACLSLGRNQPARGRYDVGGRAPGRDVVRRPTGGLAVYHDQELTYSVTCAVGVLGSPRATYLRAHGLIARALTRLGVEATLAHRAASRTPAPADPLGVCFAAPAEGEVLAAAGKLVGSAQRMEDRTILQHGSIIIDGSQDRAAPPRGASGDPTHGNGSPAVMSRIGGAEKPATGSSAGPTLTGLLGRTPTDAELVRAISAEFTTGTGIRLAPGPLSAEEVDRLPTAEARYRSDEWTWRT